MKLQGVVGEDDCYVYDADSGEELVSIDNHENPWSPVERLVHRLVAKGVIGRFSVCERGDDADPRRGEER